MQMGTKPYLKFIADARKAVKIPVIASVNCTTSSRWWVSYAKDLESAGAHAIELNISHFPRQDGLNSAAIEGQYRDIVEQAAGTVKIPVAVKIGYHFTALQEVLRSVVDAGAKGIVLFNRSYTIDVDLKKRQFIPSIAFSSPQEMALPLQWVGLAAGSLDCDIAGSTGVHTAQGALKMIMAGAAAVQVCSTLYLNGIGYLADIIRDMDAWLGSNRIGSLDDIRGLALRQTPGADILLHRLQYIKALNEAAEYTY
jgi:dihydroorotate dehydrogenase (fumarate)